MEAAVFDQDGKAKTLSEGTSGPVEVDLLEELSVQQWRAPMAMDEVVSHSIELSIYV